MTALLLALTLGWAQEPMPDSVKDRVEMLVKQLDAREKTERDAAEAALLELGEPALEFFPTDVRRAEVKLRLERIRETLLRRSSENLADAKTVTFQGDKVKLTDVLAAIETQTGNRIVDAREEGEDPELTVNFEGLSFWQALDEALDMAEVSVLPNYSENAVTFGPRADGEGNRAGRGATNGAFRFDVVEVLGRRNPRISSDAQLQLVLEASWEPRLAPVSITHRISDDSATDEQGSSLNFQQQEAVFDLPVTPGGSSAEFSVDLELPDRSITKIASMKGKILALLPAGYEKFQFQELAKAKNVERKRAGVTVVLERAQKNNELWEVRVRLKFESAGGALESHRSWVFTNPAYLLDAKGQRIDFAASELTRQGDNEAGFAFLFDVKEGLAGHTFVYETPTTIIEKEIDFELKDIPLP